MSNPAIAVAPPVPSWTKGIRIFVQTSLAFVILLWLAFMSRNLKAPVKGAEANFASAVGVTVLLVLYLLYWTSTGTWSVARLYKGADGRPSTSQFQALVWTIVAIFAYSGIYSLRATMGLGTASLQIPSNLMLAMGFTFGTLATAKGITVSYLKSGRITKTAPAAGEATSVAYDDGGEIDLTKVQMLAWTYVAVAVYMFHLVRYFDAGQYPDALPDIDAALMVLMGLSQGVYVGKKLVTADTPSLNPIAATSGPPGTPITLNGTSFGVTQGTSQITIDGNAIAPTNWNDAQIVFSVPSSHPSKGKWTTGQQILIDVIVNGRSSVAPIAFTVVLPTISNVTPKPLVAGSPFTIDGTGFGTIAIAQRSVTVGVTPAAIVSWSDQQIVATAPVGVTSPTPVVVVVAGERTAPFNV